MKNNKGFSLMELLMTITITAVMVTLMTPVLYKHVGSAQAAVCEYNRNQFLRSFNTFKVIDTEGYTLKEALDGDCEFLESESEDLTCPGGGTIYVEDGQLICSVHGAIGSGQNAEDGSSTTLIGGDALYDGAVYINSWEEVCTTTSALPWGGVSMTAGTVYVYNGVTYVVKSDNYLQVGMASQYADDPDNLYFLQQFDPDNTIESSAYNASVGWTPPLANGVVCERNGSYYVFLGSDNTTWESLPPNGNWVLLT